jgi:cyanophycinase-like exopeptidase
MMTDFVIFDVNAGHLQWSGGAADKAGALAGLQAVVGGDPIDEAQFVVMPVMGDQRAEIEAWWDNGGLSFDEPEWLKHVGRI